MTFGVRSACFHVWSSSVPWPCNGRTGPYARPVGFFFGSRLTAPPVGAARFGRGPFPACRCERCAIVVFTYGTA